MRFSILACSLSALALASNAAAYITAFSGPNGTVSAGTPFNVTFTTKVDPTNDNQYYAIFGVTTKLYANTIGSETAYSADLTKIPRERFFFNVPVTIGSFESNSAVQTLAVAVLGQDGASGGVTLQYFNTTITVADS